MAVAIDKYGNCTTDFTGTAIGTCDVLDFGDMKGIGLVKKGWSIDITAGEVALDLASYTDLVKDFTFLPFVGIYDFTQDTPENETNTSSTGVLSEIRAGKPQFSFMFTKGSCFHKSLYQKRGNSLWDYYLIFEQGMLFATNADATKVKAFDGGFLSVNTLNFVQGTDPQMSSAQVQLLNAPEFNLRNLWLPYDKAGALADVTGIIETTLTTDPIAAGTAISVSAVSTCNKDSVILDLDDPIGNWSLGGVQTSSTTISAVAYNATTSKYDITVTPALVDTDTVIVNLLGEDSLGNIYKGVSNSVTVTA
jgi:hypothetical protein